MLPPSKRRCILLRKETKQLSFVLLIDSRSCRLRGRKSSHWCSYDHQRHRSCHYHYSRLAQASSFLFLRGISHPSHIAQDALDSHKMLLPRCFHESTHISNWVSKVRACVYQIAQAPDNAAVIGGVVVPAFLSWSRASMGVLVGLLSASLVVSSSFFAYALWQMVMSVVLCCTLMPR